MTSRLESERRVAMRYKASAMRSTLGNVSCRGWPTTLPRSAAHALLARHQLAA